MRSSIYTSLVLREITNEKTKYRNSAQRVTQSENRKEIQNMRYRNEIQKRNVETVNRSRLQESQSAVDYKNCKSMHRNYYIRCYQLRARFSGQSVQSEGLRFREADPDGVADLV